MAMQVTHSEELLPLPTDAAELARCLADPEWRLFSGCLYKIMIKGDDKIAEDGSIEEGDSYVLPFRPNRAQRRFIKRLWHRNLILKARQLGFTTLIAIMWLDHALFNADQRCGIIAQDRDAAKVIFRDKVKFAYDNLPAEIRDRFPTAAANADELLFAHNNSSVRVATSMRSGTIHRLHVSEFGKICAKYPDKAQEVVTGSIPAVPTNGILVIESTAEGREGEFFKMVQVAEANHASRKKLTPRDYRMHFYAWWQEPKYRLDSSTIELTREEHDYFDKVEATVLRDMGERITIDADQRAWYVATKRADFSGAEEKMWQEYPSFPAEAFQISTEGNWYAKDMIALRKRGGVRKVLVLDAPVNTFWDIGNGDGCAIWFHQELNGEDRFIDYYEAHGEDLRHYVKELRDRGYVFGTHFLPHDADHKRLSDFNRSTKEMLQDLMPGERFAIVPLITELVTGIYQTRKHMKTAYLDETGCAKGIQRLEGYRKRYSRADNRFTDQPDKSNGCSEGADAYRQWAQAKELGMLQGVSGKKTYEEAPAPDWRL
ncbi:MULTISPECIES: terminase [unclassified Pseudomonas]|uniref:terminase n=1 Tax=unclassified Pseudomonas TaxID=196821 RepID=UPI00244C1113|nr:MULTISPECIES: terminase [unclassified Pseudomonas]MDG9927425.1 terminase [Pseudomonas sp. GD04042]MDH0482494.1 terminase [Pseudomonas sp. GD04015]MDH0602846.1 terminase [Pseudomonas sp. GD03869]